MFGGEIRKQVQIHPSHPASLGITKRHWCKLEIGGDREHARLIGLNRNSLGVRWPAGRESQNDQSSGRCVQSPNRLVARREGQRTDVTGSVSTGDCAVSVT